LTKLAGEIIARGLDDHLVVRTSWLFGGPDERTDQVLALIRRTARGEPTRLINDQFSGPTYTVDLARALVTLIERGTRGTVHVVNRGRASWYDVARFVLKGDGDETPDLAPSGSMTAMTGPGGAGSPSWTASDADATRAAPDFALIQPVSLASQDFLGRRPHDSTLDANRLAGLGITLPSWQNAVRRFRDTLAVPAR